MGLRGLALQVTVFSAAMGSMIGAASVAMDLDLDPSLTTLMVRIGIPLSFLPLPGLWWLLQVALQPVEAFVPERPVTACAVIHLR